MHFKNLACTSKKFSILHVCKPFKWYTSSETVLSVESGISRFSWSSSLVCYTVCNNNIEKAWIHLFSYKLKCRLGSLTLGGIQPKRRTILNSKIWRSQQETILLSFPRSDWNFQIIKKRNLRRIMSPMDWNKTTFKKNHLKWWNVDENADEESRCHEFGITLELL